MGDRRQVEVVLDRGRYLLESFTPHNLDHNFMVDPSKFDLYAMDCYASSARMRSRRYTPTRSSEPQRTSTAGNARMAVAAPVEGDGVRADSLFGLCLRTWCVGARGTLSA
jgi:hypothetical protein